MGNARFGIICTVAFLIFALILPLVFLKCGAVVKGSLDMTTKEFDVEMPVSGEFIYFELCLPGINSISEAAQWLKNRHKDFGYLLSDPNCVQIDFKVTIGDKTRTCSFEEIFEWMGFERGKR